MICQIIDSVDNHFGEYLRLYSWHNSKQPADCKLMHETVQQLHAELSQTGGIRLLNLNCFTETTKTKLVSFTYIGHVFCLSSMGYRVL